MSTQTSSPAPPLLASSTDKSRVNVSLNCANLFAVFLDYLSIAAGTLLGLALYHAFRSDRVSNELLKLFAFSLQYLAAFVVIGRTQQLYRFDHTLLEIRRTAAVLRVSFFSMLLLSVFSFFGKLVVPRLLLISCWICVTACVLFQKHMTRTHLSRLIALPLSERRVLIVGSGPDARRVFSLLLKSPEARMRPVLFLEEQDFSNNHIIYSHDYRFKDHAPVHRGTLDATLLSRFAVTDIFIADPLLGAHRVAEIAALGLEYDARLSFVGPSQSCVFGKPSSLRVLDGMFITSCDDEQPTGHAYEYLKRSTDLLASAVLLFVTLPLFIVVAAWIKGTSPGPVFFRQERVGQGGARFKMYKFRSMYVTAPIFSRSPESHDDPRITKAGKYLRKTSIDELPQLINVMRGDMSLVGPRPEMPYIASRYSAQQSRRLAVKQGLTGLWQLSADRQHAIHESLEYDLYYIDNRGVFLDAAILLHTLAFAARGV